MRLPRHDTLLSLPAEPPAAALSADEALLAQLLAHEREFSDTAKPSVHGQLLGHEREFSDTAERSERACRLRLWVASSPAVVVGLGLHHRLTTIVDIQRCERADVQVLERRAGGGALLLDEYMLCGAVAVPITNVSQDVTESYRWLADLLLAALESPGARRVEVAEAREDIARLRQNDNLVTRALLATCYGALSPHEIVVDSAHTPKKLVGLAQIRRRHAALFQFGILLRDQSPLAEYLALPDPLTRQRLRTELQARTTSLTAVTHRSASAVAAAIVDAMPSAV
jgi:lipoate-protein ligase A